MRTRALSLAWIKRIVLFGLAPVLVLVMAMAAAGWCAAYSMVEFMKDMSAYHHSLKFPNSIDELGPVEIGGIDQWISIRGHNQDAPILLFLHGGPGADMIRIEHEIASQWEEFFTVVFWDQRGAGKSYYPTAKIGETMTVERLLDDTGEMIAYLRERFGREKIFVVGHSWGSVLGIQMAKLHPDWLYAYVGVSQVINSIESKCMTYDRLLALLSEKGDEQGVETLMRMTPFSDPSMPIDVYYRQWGQVQCMLTPCGLNEFYRKTDPGKNRLFLLSVLLRSHTVSLPEIYRDAFSKDNPSALASLREGVRRTDIPAQVGFEFDVPIFFVSGKNDLQVHYRLSADYFSKISAPSKEILLLENSAHVLMVDEPGRFFAFLVDRVLPLATSK